MTAVSIRRDCLPLDVPRFRATAGEKEAVGRTMGEALDALTADWGEEMRETAILIQRFGPDAFFSQAQQDRMQELLVRRAILTQQERQELEFLVVAELDATVARLEHQGKPAQPASPL